MLLGEKKTMWHILEFRKILDFNYTRIGLSIYVKFSLGKWLGAREKIIQNRSQKTQNRANSYRVREQKYNTTSTYYFSSKHQHYQAMNDIKMVTYSVLKYPESCKLILSQHIFSGVGTVSAQIRHHC